MVKRLCCLKQGRWCTVGRLRCPGNSVARSRTDPLVWTWSCVYICNSVNFNLGSLASCVVVLFNNGGKHVKTVEAVDVQLSLQDVRAIHVDTLSSGSETAYRQPLYRV